MRKEITRKVPAVKARPATIKKLEVITCDICSKELHPYTYGWGKKGSQCKLCGRDMCKSCSEYDPDEPGDYPDKYCTICLKIYLPARRIMEERHWAEEEKLVDRIKGKSLKSKNIT